MGAQGSNCVAGLDLAGSPRRPSGYAVACSAKLTDYGIVYADDEVLEKLRGARVVAIDAPLSLPKSGRGFRKVDLKLIRMGYRVLPPTMPGMRMLTERAIALAKRLEHEGVKVIETHPRSAWMNSGCGNELEAASKILANVPRGGRLLRDVVDAIVAAAVAWTYMVGRAVRVEAQDGVIYLLPRLCHAS